MTGRRRHTPGRPERTRWPQSSGSDLLTTSGTQAQAGKLLGIPQPHVSDLLNGRARGFSAERLMEFLAALGHDVEVRVKPTRKGPGQVSVVVAA